MKSSEAASIIFKVPLKNNLIMSSTEVDTGYMGKSLIVKNDYLLAEL
jgi:hypothetical protein